MKYVKYITVLFLSNILLLNIVEGKTYDIRKYGAKGDDKTLNTKALNDAIDACYIGGGGKVLVPKGIFVIGSISLKDNVHLYLEEGAILKATSDLDQYLPYIPTKDLSKFDTNVAENVNSSLDLRWNRALILAIGTNNASISGEGIIDGIHLFDPLGEEKMRGPHIIMIAESRNFSLSGVTLNRAANYGVMAYLLENVVFDNLNFNEGWDGIHIRGGKNVTIRNCRFQTGDDAIAGGYWENMTITDCYINSSCNGIRMIMPAEKLTISNCEFKGPGEYPHRTSKEKMRRNSLSAILLQPGGWGISPGQVKDIHIHDIKIDNVNNPMMMVLNEGNSGTNILVERLHATNINQAALSIESWKGGIFRNVVFRDVSIEYVGNNDSNLKNIQFDAPQFDARLLPCWGVFVRNVHDLTFENIDFKLKGKDSRPALWFDNTNNVTFKNFKYEGSKDDKSFVKINFGTFINQ